MKKLDFHVHIINEISIEESVFYFKDLCRRKGYVGVGIMAASYATGESHPNCNEQALAVRAEIPNSYAFASLHHDRDFVEQAKQYMEQGFEGIKLLEGKPTLYRHYGYGFEHPRYEPFFAYAEEHRIPLLIHNNDPIEHWDITKMSERAIRKGWYYDETFPNQEHFFRVLEQDVLGKHPNLCVALAHFGFYSTDLNRADALMQKHPNLMMDATPALNIYDELSRTPERTREFFLKYHDRILFGTDAENLLVGEALDLNERKTALLQAFYEGDKPFTLGRHSVVGMHFDKDLLEEIYYYNALRFMGLQA